ncbi:MAG: PAS domain-containing protein [candidate division Zixibacteria bacterium]|nr:PAS domain-containing protein [candidate division Zixibacteria bacterium]
MRSNKRVDPPRRLSDMIFQELFHQVPFNVAVIDREYNIVEANNNFTEYFGSWKNKKCYAVYKKLKKPCKDCPSIEVFKKGKPIVADAVGIDQHGRKTHYVGHVFPLRSKKGGKVDYALEMTRTVTETDRWQQEYQILFDRVPCYITVIGEDYRIVRANEAFRENFGDVLGQLCYKVYKRRKTKCPNCPAAKTFRDGRNHHSTQLGTGKRGQDIHYAVSTSPLMRGSDNIAHVIEISNDITAIKKLEHDVIEAERLGAVGQTVAGLAHSIKNILMGLEGGKYIVSLGLDKNDKEMISEGWEMLDRNFEKTTSLVKDFLSFSKGRLPKLKMVKPGYLVEEIIDLYKDIASQSGIELKSIIDKNVKRAPLDPDGIHTCLTNLVSNAIDACLMGKQKGTEVLIKVREGRDNLIFEVSDNGSGIDYEIKKKIFTTFFTTKGGEGTGLGLLTTRKIVQEHGGKILVDSKEGNGARFRMEFPRKRLITLYKEAK